MVPFTIGRGIDVMGVTLLAAGGGLLLWFAWWERGRDQQGRTAATPLRMFAARSFTTGLATTFLGFAGFTACFLVLSLLWQEGIGHSALATGLLTLPYAIGNIVGAMLIRRVSTRLGARIVPTGLGLIAGGLTCLGVLLRVLPAPAVTSLTLAVPLPIIGVGAGLVVGPNTDVAVARIEREDAGVASGLLGTAQRSGTALGVGVVAAVLSSAVPGPAYLHTAARASFVTAAFVTAALLAFVALNGESKPRTGPAAS